MEFQKLKGWVEMKVVQNRTQPNLWKRGKFLGSTFLLSASLLGLPLGAGSLWSSPAIDVQAAWNSKSSDYTVLPEMETKLERGFLSSTDRAILYLDKTEFYFTEDNEELKFVNLKNGTLKLMSADGTTDYMSFVNYDGAKGGVAFVIRPIYAVLPKGTFYEITADVGAHGKNCGFWLIGKRDGQWVTYVSIDSLATMGYTPDQWHRIKTETNGDATGRYILTSEHEYMPPGAKYGYERRVATDLALQLFWDKKAQWFGMRRL